MGRKRRVLVVPQKSPASLPPDTALERRKPRSFLEWKTLGKWKKLPVREEDPPGFLLRRLREGAGLSQRELAEHLRCSQQAVAQAERWDANPTFKFAREWARALGSRMSVRFDENGA